ncbi:MAG: leucine-rich repeat protein, partial [Bacteroidales bacterium]|nr:leucine-rich repeat protein [Bacteroidales bacterium]
MLSFYGACNILKIRKSLFEGHSKLETINFVLPTKIEEIEDKVFKDCRKLKNIILP